MKPDWIAVDWGTSNLRIWAMCKTGEVLAERRSDQGMAGLSAEEFEPVLLSHISEWLGDGVMPIIACGMVGSRQGWQEAPYDSVPAAPSHKTIRVNTKDSRIDVHIVAGIKQDDPADVMRGEETQIAGFLVENPDFEGALCLPGTHSKWVCIKGGQLQRFQTAMTGELFALLTTQSVLRHSRGEWDDGCFLSAMRSVFDNPAELGAALFEIRAKNLLENDQCGIARISGSLIGAELAAVQNYWQGKPSTIIGAGELARIYALALRALGAEVHAERASLLTLKGLQKVYGELFSCEI